MRKILSILILSTSLLISFSSSAHLIYFGYLDNGDGTVDLYGQHYHSLTQSTGSGLTFTDITDSSNVFTSLWNGTLASTSINNLPTTLTQAWDLSTSYNDSNNYNWLISSNVSLENGSFLVTATNPTAVDRPWSTLPTINVTGVTQASAPSTVLLLSIAFVAFGARRINRKANKAS